MLLTEKNQFKKAVFILTIGVFSLGLAQDSKPSPTWDVYFSPRGGATFAVRQALDNAKSSVLLQAYSFTSAPIAEALVKAHRRGVKSKAAEESNAENLLVVRDKDLASRYIENWQLHDEHSEVYRSKAQRKSKSSLSGKR